MKSLVRLVQREAERKLGVPADYLGFMGESSFSGFLKFLLLLPLAGHRRRADPALAHAVRLVATQHEDCGPCVQIAVNAALAERMDPEAIRAVLERRLERLPEKVALAVRFAEGVLLRDGSEEAARDEIARQLGASVLTELSLAIASARVFPTVKRGLGFARSCSLVEVSVEPRRRRQPGGDPSARG
jgi:alkylhydroperoxidase family enzyme